MPILQTMAGREVMPPIALVQGATSRFKIVPKVGEHLPFRVSRSRDPLVAVERLDNRVGPNFAIFDLRGVAVGDTEIQIDAAAGGTPLRVAVRVEAAVGLPPVESEAGMLARLLLAESASPGDPGYSLGDARVCMQLMRIVLANRLARPDVRWASAGARSLRDVIRARNQFAGFDAYPALSTAVAARIADKVRIANTPSDARQRAMRAHVALAIEIATATTPRDPTKTGLYWWRTDGARPPGTNIVTYRTVLGNTFWREGP